MRTCYIYVIGSTAGYLKIGYTSIVRKRLAALQNASPEQLTLEHSIPVKPSMVYKLEKRIHNKLKQYRMRGEWFAVSIPEAIDAVESVARRHRQQCAYEAEADPALLRVELRAINRLRTQMMNIPPPAKPELRQQLAQAANRVPVQFMPTVYQLHCRRCGHKGQVMIPYGAKRPKFRCSRCHAHHPRQVFGLAKLKKRQR